MRNVIRFFLVFCGAFDIGWGGYNLIFQNGPWYMALYYMLLVALGIFFIKQSLKK